MSSTAIYIILDGYGRQTRYGLYPTMSEAEAALAEFLATRVAARPDCRPAEGTAPRVRNADRLEPLRGWLPPPKRGGRRDGQQPVTPTGSPSAGTAGTGRAHAPPPSDAGPTRPPNPARLVGAGRLRLRSRIRGQH